MTKPLKVRRTVIATSKLEEIYEYSCEEWGARVAGKYLNDIENIIQQAAIGHGGTKMNPKFSRRFTYTPVRQHFVFFDVAKNTLFVATIFHGVMDIKERLADEMIAIQRDIGN